MERILNVYDIEITEHRHMKARTARGRAWLADHTGAVTNLTATVQQILAAGLTVTMPR